MTQNNILNPPYKRMVAPEAKREFTPVYAGYVDQGHSPRVAFADDEPWYSSHAARA